MIHRWDGTHLVAAPEPVTVADVADSWLEHDGYVGSWHLHRQRFSASLPGRDLGHFLDAVRTHIPHEGDWFPRIEAHGDELYLRVRPAPPRRTTTTLWLPPTPDPRRTPLVKGPDLPILGELRDRARHHGADDALLYSTDGFVVEGANCALGWWEEGDFMIPSHPDRLPSVTVAAHTGILGAPGTRPILPDELQQFTVWAGSALHGWTEVDAWITAQGEIIPARRTATPMSTQAVNTLLRWA